MDADTSLRKFSERVFFVQDFLGNTGELGAEQRPSFSLCEDDGWESKTPRCSQGALQVGLCLVLQGT